ncbi:hypothetical protein SAMN05216553_118159 [Lentzea fradiae]|uniref:Phosphotransferase enzyme family protein n=1 Tax=Lentzea fradiae TaxID=200378 RepID=A0A1G8AX12_9PSEU|nr:hypothetical protein [Lentzea fradiae]SDH25346.1 hypothetical protein SAMN05216553_118159 [Lentzea fradiae]
MPQRTDWESLPEALHAAVIARTGPVLKARTVSEGLNSALAAVLRTESGTVFVKGLRTDQPGVITQGREALINAHVWPIAPALLWHIEDVAGWNVLGFEHVEGRHPDYSPGSPDLPLVTEALDLLAVLRCPDLPIKNHLRWRSYLDGQDPEILAGGSLLHTDFNPANVLITPDGTVRMVDWAWPTRGAAWIDACCLIIWLIASGHTPAEAEAEVQQARAWRDAPPTAVDVFALANIRLWDEIVSHKPSDWHRQMAEAARAWADSRMVTVGTS